MTQGNGIFKALFGWLPAWVGFSAIILAGALALIFGFALTPSPGLVAFGVAAIAAASLSWATGAGSTPYVDPSERSFGGTVDHLRAWVWLVVFVLFAGAVLVAVLFR